MDTEIMSHWLDTYSMGKAKDTNYVSNSAKQVRGLLSKVGLRQPVLDYSTSLVMHETAGGRAGLVKKDLNLSGIKYTANSPFQAGKGTRSPEGDYYAHYPSYDNWAKDYVRVISLGGANSALLASSLPDFAHRLKVNGYYKAPETTYLKGLITWSKKIPAMENAAGKEMDVAVYKKKKQDEEAGMSWARKHPLITGAALAVAGVIVVKTLTRR